MGTMHASLVPRRHARARLARTSVALFAVAACLVATAVPTSAAPTDDRGLFGHADPTYDGVFRQAIAILGLDAAGRAPSAAALGWLLNQQCADGSFASYRPDTSLPCSSLAPEVGSQTDSTALAALALAQSASPAARRASRRAMDWLVTTQLPAGSWRYQGTGDANANSTGLAVFALRSTRPTSPAVRAGTRFLTTLTRDCSSGGGLPYQAGGPTDLMATAQGIWAFGAQVPIRSHPVRRNPTCTATVRDRLASPLTNAIMTSGLLPSSFGTGSDPGGTASAVIGLAGMGVGQGAITRALSALASPARRYASPGTENPAGLGLFMMANAAAGRDPDRLGGVDLMAALLASEQR